MTTYEVVVGESGASLRFPLLNDAGTPAVPVGNVGVDVLGASLDLPGVPIVVAGFHDVADNTGVFENIGAWVKVEKFGERRKATFQCNLRWTDSDGEHFQPAFAIRFVRLASALEEEEQQITPYETRHRFTVHRTYNFATLPATKRNTFAGATIVSRPPCVAVTTAGSVAETNKIIELMPEVYHDVDNSNGGILLPNGGFRGDVRHSIRANLSSASGDLAARALIGADAFVALGFGSFDANVPPSSTSNCAFFQIRKGLKNPLDWWCVASAGNGAPVYTSPKTTLPNVATEFTGIYEPAKDNGGEIVEMRFDPFNKVIRAWARGVLICELSDPAYYPIYYMYAGAYPSPVVSFVVFSGTQTGAISVTGMLGGLVVEDYGVTQLGAGLLA